MFQIHLRSFQGTPDSPWEASAEDPHWKEINANPDLVSSASEVEGAREVIIGDEEESASAASCKGVTRDKANSATLL